ncbi:uncharacterized protein ly97.3 isoform X2 [Festucalex cinctus]
MKLLLLALSVTLLFIAGKALNCHHCVPTTASENCELTVETCKSEKDGCASARFRLHPEIRYQECMTTSVCQMFINNKAIDVKCCNTDMCNTA